MTTISLKVLGKGLKGKGNKTAYVVLGGEDGSKLSLILDSKSQLDGFKMGELFEFKLSQEQQKLE